MMHNVSKSIKFPALAFFAFAAMGATPALANASAAADITAPILENSNDQANGSALGASDSEFKTLFASWKSLDRDSAGRSVASGTVSIPQGMPVHDTKLTSEYGTRSDPFNGRRRRHKGIDLAGPIGTPIYATADGVVSRARWVGGYGNFVEIEHGGELQTRYGHMSRLAVDANQRVSKGEIIGYMGSTGRSTGSHLHYEVRIAGEAVNPTPFMNSDETKLASVAGQAVGGPAE